MEQGLLNEGLAMGFVFYNGVVIDVCLMESLFERSLPLLGDREGGKYGRSKIRNICWEICCTTRDSLIRSSPFLIHSSFQPFRHHANLSLTNSSDSLQSFSASSLDTALAQALSLI